MQLSIDKIQQDLSGRRVLVIGDIMLDQYIKGAVNRISPEAPVPVLEIKERSSKPGGAANVAANLVTLGAEVSLLATLGSDEHGSRLKSTIAEHGIDTTLLICDESKPTTVKTRIMSQGQHILRLDREIVNGVSVDVVDKLNVTLNSIKGYDAVILQDYNKGLFTTEVIKSCISWAKNHRIPSFLDPKKDNFLSYKGIDFVKPNFLETAYNVPFDVTRDEGSLRKASNYIISELACKEVMITLSEDGCFLSDGESICWERGMPIKVRDVSGAGDSVMAMYTLAHLAGYDFEQKAYLCNLIGRVACRYPGVVPVSYDMLAR